MSELRPLMLRNWRQSGHPERSHLCQELTSKPARPSHDLADILRARKEKVPPHEARQPLNLHPGFTVGEFLPRTSDLLHDDLIMATGDIVLIFITYKDSFHPDNVEAAVWGSHDGLRFCLCINSVPSAKDTNDSGFI
jgi:hypothetical protein